MALCHFGSVLGVTASAQGSREGSETPLAGRRKGTKEFVAAHVMSLFQGARHSQSSAPVGVLSPKGVSA